MSFIFKELFMAMGNFELSNWSTKIIHVRKTLVYIFIFCSCADLLEQIFHFVEHFKSDMFQLDMLDSNTHISLQGAFINRFKFMWCMRWPLDLSYYDEGHGPLRSGAFSTCSRSLLQVLKTPRTVVMTSFFDQVLCFAVRSPNSAYYKTDAASQK